MTSRTKLKAILRPLFPPRIHADTLSPPSSRVDCPQLTEAPALPFFRDPGHTIPTKWALYRPLLRATTAFPAIKRDVKETWRRRKGWTSVPRVRHYLKGQYDLLGRLQDDSPSLNSLENQLQQRQQAEDDNRAHAEAAQKERAPPRTHLTGSYHRPTLFNPPLPRMKPQPIDISHMIHNRLRARERRIERRRTYAGLLVDIRLEQAFWRTLESGALKAGAGAGAGGTKDNEKEQGEIWKESSWSKSKDPRSPGGWDKVIKDEIAQMDQRFARENKRAEEIFTPAMMDRVGRAKQRRLAWRKEQREAQASKKPEIGSSAQAPIGGRSETT